MGDLPVLDESRCVGCGDCVAVCPTACLAMRGPTPWLPRPADCVSCGACAIVCPTGAIHVPGKRGFTAESAEGAEGRPRE